MRETQVRSLGQEDPLVLEMATHSGMLVWRILWTEDPGRLYLWGRKELNTTEWLTHNPSHCFVLLPFLDKLLKCVDYIFPEVVSHNYFFKPLKSSSCTLLFWKWSSIITNHRLLSNEHSVNLWYCNSLLTKVEKHLKYGEKTASGE